MYRHSMYRIVFKKRILMLTDAVRVCTVPTTGKASYLSLKKVLGAIETTSKGGVVSTHQVAAHLELQETKIETVLVPALDAICEKGYIEWVDGCHIRQL